MIGDTGLAASRVGDTARGGASSSLADAAASSVLEARRTASARTAATSSSFDISTTVSSTFDVTSGDGSGDVDAWRSNSGVVSGNRD